MDAEGRHGLADVQPSGRRRRRLRPGRDGAERPRGRDSGPGEETSGNPGDEGRRRLGDPRRSVRFIHRDPRGAGVAGGLRVVRLTRPGAVLAGRAGDPPRPGPSDSGEC